jgi:transaldolase
VELSKLGQSIWYDNIERKLITSGELRRLIDEDDLRGVTSNPAIFEKAISGSDLYEDQIRELIEQGAGAADIYEALAIRDIQSAADELRRVYDRTDKLDGYVSLECSPLLASDTQATIDEARRLWGLVARPNVMIKIPATAEGIPAIEQCLYEGININITLLLSLEHYSAVAEAYLKALEARVAKGQPIDRLASVASIFVSRVDTEVDKRIEKQGGALKDLLGKVAIATAKVDYGKYLEIVKSPRWKAVEAKGARTQRLLWASTGTKNPKYSDVIYVDSLIAPDTISTVPPETLKLFEDHGTVALALQGDVAGPSRQIMDALAAGGIDYADVNRVLEDEGIDKFQKSFDKLMSVIAAKRKTLAQKAAAPAR